MRIGILGSGQLGRMIALAGYPLGCSFRFYDEKPGTPCAGLGEMHTGEWSDAERLAEFARGCSAVTYEFENVPCAAARALTQIVPVYPPPQALEVSQDRLTEKEFLRSLGIATPRFCAASTEAELHIAAKTVGFPCVVKTRRFGYDGKGQYVLKSDAMIHEAWGLLGPAALIVEEFIPFDRELSIIGVRSTTGEIRSYPVIHNIHRDGILRRSQIPAPHLTNELEQRARTLISTVLDRLQYVGILTVELFERAGELIANEMAPRVHNSGHSTIEASVTSQFENHLRAVAGLALGSTEMRVDSAVMFNLIGASPSIETLAAIEGAKAHLYDKSAAPGRKVGHVTLLSSSMVEEKRISSLLPDWADQL
jgi:5-(carboxyamino)imidazole ribonucleotide synthase